MRISDWSSDVCSSDLPCRWPARSRPSHSQIDAARIHRLQLLEHRGHLEGAVVVHQHGSGPETDARRLRGGRGDQEFRMGGRLRRRHVMLDQPDAMIPPRYLPARSEEHTSELQSLMRISYAVFCLTKKTTTHNT